MCFTIVYHNIYYQSYTIIFKDSSYEREDQVNLMGVQLVKRREREREREREKEKERERERNRERDRWGEMEKEREREGGRTNVYHVFYNR